MAEREREPEKPAELDSLEEESEDRFEETVQRLLETPPKPRPDKRTRKGGKKPPRD